MPRSTVRRDSASWSDEHRSAFLISDRRSAIVIATGLSIVVVVVVRRGSSGTRGLVHDAQHERREAVVVASPRRARSCESRGMSNDSTRRPSAVGHQALGEACAGTRPGASSSAARRPIGPFDPACRRRDRRRGSTGAPLSLDAPAAGDVEVLEREAERIDHAVARAALRVRAMLLHALAHRQQPRRRRRAFVSSSAGTFGGGGGGGDAEQHFHAPTCRAAPATCDRRPTSASRMLPWPSRPRRFSSASVTRRKSAAVDVRDAVVARERARSRTCSRRVSRSSDAAILADDAVEEELGLALAAPRRALWS